MAVFEARDLGKMFAGPHPYVALQHVNLQIDEGEFLCILGEPLRFDELLFTNALSSIDPKLVSTSSISCGRK